MVKPLGFLEEMYEKKREIMVGIEFFGTHIPKWRIG
jgi:hypothetical protein